VRRAVIVTYSIVDDEDMTLTVTLVAQFAVTTSVIFGGTFTLLQIYKPTMAAMPESNTKVPNNTIAQYGLSRRPSGSTILSRCFGGSSSCSLYGSCLNDLVYLLRLG